MKRIHVQTVDQAAKILANMGTLHKNINTAGAKLAKRLGERYSARHDVAAMMAATRLSKEAQYINFGIKNAEQLMSVKLYFSGRLRSTTPKISEPVFPTWGY